MTDVQILAGMVPWTGGDSAPTDWDGGPVKLKSGGFWIPPAPGHFRTFSDIIFAYMPSTPVERTEPRTLASMMLELQETGTRLSLLLTRNDDGDDDEIAALEQQRAKLGDEARERLLSITGGVSADMIGRLL